MAVVYDTLPGYFFICLNVYVGAVDWGEIAMGRN